MKTIPQKYRIGDTVWWLESKAVNGIVTGVFFVKDDSSYRYSIEKELPSSSYHWRKEEYFFSSKQELLNSL